MDRGAWQATVHGVAKSTERLSLSHSMCLMENKIYTYFSQSCVCHVRRFCIHHKLSSNTINVYVGGRF